MMVMATQRRSRRIRLTAVCSVKILAIQMEQVQVFVIRLMGPRRALLTTPMVMLLFSVMTGRETYLLLNTLGASRLEIVGCALMGLAVQTSLIQMDLVQAEPTILTARTSLM